MEEFLIRLQKLEDEVKREREINHTLQLQIADINEKIEENKEENYINLEDHGYIIHIIKEDLDQYTSDIIEIEDKKYTFNEISSYCIPIICLLNIDNKLSGLFEMLDYITNHEEKKTMFNNLCFRKYNRNNCFELINKIMNKYITKDSEMYNNTILIKMQLMSICNNPNELVKFILSTY
jgi:hypothetical protein